MQHEAVKKLPSEFAKEQLRASGTLKEAQKKSHEMLVVAKEGAFRFGELLAAEAVDGAVLIMLRGEATVLRFTPIEPDSFWQYVRNAKTNPADRAGLYLGSAKDSDSDPCYTDARFCATAFLVGDSDGNVEIRDVNGFFVELAGFVKQQGIA